MQDSASELPGPGVLQKRLFLGLFFGLLVYAGFVLWADAGGIRDALKDFNLWLLPLACGLSFLNYVVRFARWQRYCKLLDVKLKTGTSFLIYLAGLSLTVTPGKMGEVFKSWMIREVDGSPVTRTAPIVIAERFTDLLAFLVLVGFSGIATQPDYAWIFWVTLVLCAFLLVLFGSERAAHAVCGILARVPVVGRFAPKLVAAFDSTRILTSPRELVLPTFVATIGWGLECLGFWLIANSLLDGGDGGGVPFLFATYSFALAAVAGAVVILFPGGLGITEGTMSGLLQSRYSALGVATEAARAKAVSATLLIRLCTLWFAVAVGLIALALFRRSRRVD